MKNRILSLLLVLVLLVTVSVFAVEASDPIEFDESTKDATTGAVEAWCDACGENVIWRPFIVTTLDRGDVLSKNSQEGSHFYVPQGDWTVSAYFSCTGNLCVYLNGNVTGEGTSTSNSSIFLLSSTSAKAVTLSVMGTGSIVQEGVRPIFVLGTNRKSSTGALGTSTVKIYGDITLDASNVEVSGAVVYDDASKENKTALEVHGGTLIGSNVESTTVTAGGAVHMTGAMTMDGGTIRDGYVTTDADNNASGGNVYLGGGSTFTMSGGTISGGKAIGSKKSSYGGNVFVGGGSTFTMSGDAEIYGGTAENSRSGSKSSSPAIAGGGNVYMGDTATVNISGGKIYGGLAKTTGTKYSEARGGNVCINSKSGDAASQINISGGEIYNGVSEGYYDAMGGNLYTYNYAQLTISDSAQISEGKVKVYTVDAGTDTEREGEGYGGNIYFVGGTFGMTGGTIKDGYCRNETAEHCYKFDLRGASIFLAGGTVNITGGKLIHTESVRRAYAGGIIANDGAALTIGGGVGTVTIEGGYANYGGNIYAHSGSVVIKEGADLSKGDARYDGSSVCINNTATFTMSGGSITGGEARDDGGAVYVSKQFTMTGGTITGGEAVNGGALALGKGGVKNSSFVSAEITGGTINAGTVSGDGDAIYVPADYSLKIGNATVNGDVAVAGKLTVAQGLTSKLNVCFLGTTDAVLVDDKIVDTMAAAENYTTGGFVIAEIEGEEYLLVGEDTALVLAEAAICNGDGMVSIPANATAAGSSLNSGEYIKLYKSGVAINLSKDTIVDFNGNNATVTTNGYDLTGMDSQTNDYNADGAAKVTFNVTPKTNNVVNLTIGGVNGQRKYLALSNGDGTYSYHRYYLTIDGAGLRYNEEGPGLLYSATFRGDAKVAEAINNGGGYGIEYFYGEESLHAENFAPSTPFATDGKRQEGRKVAFFNFMTVEKAYKIPGTETFIADAEITGKAYIQIGDEKIYCSVGDTNSLQDVIKVYYNSADPVIAEMKEKYGTVFSEILEWDFAD